MKKVVFILAVAAGLSSCKKEYSCECKTTISAAGVTISENTISESISKKMSKKTATASCDNTKSILEKQVKNQSNGLDASVSCALK